MPSSKLGFYGCLKGFRATVAAIGSPNVCKEGLWYQQETSKLKKRTRVSQFLGTNLFLDQFCVNLDSKSATL